MIARKLLIVHDSRVIRNLLNGYVLAELDDVAVLQASSVKEAAKMVASEPVNIILCADYLKDGEGYDLLSAVQSDKPGAQVPFIVFTSMTTQDHLDEFRAKGVKQFLITPFTSLELKHKIDEVFNPVQLRTQQRYNIPGTAAIIHLEDQNIGAEVINLSISSVFCEFRMPSLSAELLNSIYISIRFPSEYDDAFIGNIYCKLLSFKTINWLPNDSPETVRVVWLFKNLSQRNESSFADVLSKAEAKNKHLSEL